MDRERLLLDFFTEVAIVEHLVRNHIETLPKGDLTAAEFGLINYFVRNARDAEPKAMLAWCFQVTIDEMETVVAGVERRGYVRREGVGDDQLILLTEAGRAAQIEIIGNLAPDIAPLMEEFSDDDLGKAVEVLQETRRIFDNLPERLSA